MPGFAGSSAYYLRYMDPHNEQALVSKEANEYWQDVDLYIGGTEHAVGHLMYSRFWNKFLFDLGYVVKDEPFKKLVNQGMIQGRSSYVYRIKGTNKFASANLKTEYEVTEIHVDVNLVSNDILDIEGFRNWRPEFANAEFIYEPDGKYHCGYGVEKMSKSMFNVVSPDDIVDKYGADTLRLYEMFLGPLEQSKPWDTNGIEGVHRFLNKLWRLYIDQDGKVKLNADKPTKEEQKAIHKTIKKVQEDIEKFSLNTTVSAYMICVSELTALKSTNKEVLENLLLIRSPFAPHIAEELWQSICYKTSITEAKFPKFVAKHLKEDSIKYPIAFNGKVRFTIEVPSDMKKADIEKTALADAQTIKRLDGKTPKKVIVVPKKMVNIVI